MRLHQVSRLLQHGTESAQRRQVVRIPVQRALVEFDCRMLPARAACCECRTCEQISRLWRNLDGARQDFDGSIQVAELHRDHTLQMEQLGRRPGGKQAPGNDVGVHERAARAQPNGFLERRMQGRGRHWAVRVGGLGSLGSTGVRSRRSAALGPASTLGSAVMAPPGERGAPADHLQVADRHAIGRLVAQQLHAFAGHRRSARGAARDRS